MNGFNAQKNFQNMPLKIVRYYLTICYNEYGVFLNINASNCVYDSYIFIENNLNTCGLHITITITN